MKWFKRILSGLFILVVLAGTIIAFLPKPVRVEAVTIGEGPLQVTVDEDGITRVQDRYTILAPLAGNLARIELKPGDDVSEGQVIAHIEPIAPPLLDARTQKELQARRMAAESAKRQAEAHAKRSELALNFSKNELTRKSTLAKHGSIPQTELERAELATQSATKELESARFGVRVARYELETAKAMLARAQKSPQEHGEQLEIKAPLTGRILRVQRESEGAIMTGTPILELADPKALEIVVDVLTEDAVKIATGSTVYIHRWGGEQTLKGHVRLIEPSAYTKVSALGVEEQRVNVIIDLSDPPEMWKNLGDGYRVEVKIVIEEYEKVVKVPASALFRSRENQWNVFVIADGMAVLRDIEVGARSGLEVEVRSGLVAGDRVIIHPSDQLRDGTKIEVMAETI